jgi:hypothetical protein
MRPPFLGGGSPFGPEAQFGRLPPMTGSSFFHQLSEDPSEPDYMSDYMMNLNDISADLSNLYSKNPFDSIVGKYTH